MKKFKSLLAIALVVASITSCSKDESLTTEVQNKEILSFNSEKEMNEKIAEIEKFKADQEAAILEKILKRNNLKAPTADDFKNIDNSKVTQLDEKAILEDVKFYHTLKLEAIYAERAHFGFTSIQSIADEINFNKLVNSEKSNSLYDEYDEFLIKTDFDVKSIFKDQFSSIINKDGKISSILKKNYDVYNHETSFFAKSSNSYELASGYSNFIKILFTVSADDPYLTFNNIYSTVKYNYPVKIKTNSFVLSSSGYVAYPCFFFFTNNSNATFLSLGTNPIESITVPFLNGYGSSLLNSNTVIIPDYNNGVSQGTGFVSGSFAIPINGDPNQGFFWAYGSKNF